MPLTTDERLEALEAAMKRVEQGLIDGLAAADTKAERRAVAAAKLVTDQFTTSNASILALSQTLNTVQASITRWGAAAALLGAVILFICVRALGF